MKAYRQLIFYWAKHPLLYSLGWERLERYNNRCQRNSVGEDVNGTEIKCNSNVYEHIVNVLNVMKRYETYPKGDESYDSRKSNVLNVYNRKGNVNDSYSNRKSMSRISIVSQRISTSTNAYTFNEV